MCPGLQGAESVLCRGAGKPPSRGLHAPPTTQGASPEGGVLPLVTSVMASGAGGPDHCSLSPGFAPLLCLTTALLPAWLCTPQVTLSACSLQPGSGQETARRVAAQGPWAEEWAELRELVQEADLALELVTAEATAEVIAEAMEEATAGAMREVRAETTEDGTAGAIGEARTEATGRPQEGHSRGHGGGHSRGHGGGHSRGHGGGHRKATAEAIAKVGFKGEVRVCFQACGVWSCKRPCHQHCGGSTPRAAAGREGA